MSLLFVFFSIVLDALILLSYCLNQINLVVQSKWSKKTSHQLFPLILHHGPPPANLAPVHHPGDSHGPVYAGHHHHFLAKDLSMEIMDPVQNVQVIPVGALQVLIIVLNCACIAWVLKSNELKF